LLSDYSDGDQHLGSPEWNWLTDPLVTKPWEDYCATLHDISKKIEKRNALLKESGLHHFDYPYLS